MSVLRWSLDYEKQQYYISEKDYADLLERYRKIYYENLERYEGYSRGSKNELLRILNDNPNFFGIWLPYSLIGHSEKAKHIIDTMLNHNLSEHIINTSVKIYRAKS